MQFGYVVFFSSAFPLAALCALVNNLIEIRSDAFKLCTALQRPFGQRVESIGQWQVGQSGRPRGDGSPCLDLSQSLLPPLQKVMEAMGVLAIVVNCYLIGQCGQLQRLFPWLSPEAAIVSVVVLEVWLVVPGVGAGRRSQASLSPQPPCLSPTALGSAGQVPHPCNHP